MNRSNSRLWRIGSTRRDAPARRPRSNWPCSPGPGRGSLALGEPHDVPADEEELGEAGPLDDVELVGKLPDDGRSHRVIAPSGALVAQPGRYENAVSPSGTGKPGKRYRSKPRSTGTSGQLAGSAHTRRPGSRRRGRRDAAGSPRRQGAHLGGRLQVRLAVGSTEVAEPPRASDRGGSRSGRPGSRGPRQGVVDSFVTTTGRPTSAASAPVSATSQSSSGRRWCWSSRTKPAGAPDPP